jgi:branched-chain amino acid transport system substrate-binding protein
MAQKGMSRNKLIAIVVIVIVVVGVVGVGAYYLSITPTTPPPTAPSKIIVGWTEPDTGAYAVLTPIYDIYYKWIIEDYNASGGLYIPQYGKKIPFGNPVIYDDGSNINTMITDYVKLITVDKVNLLFGPISTGMNLALFPTLQQYKMPMIALTFGSDVAGAEMRSGVFSYAFSILGFPAESADQIVQVFQHINSTVDKGGLQSVAILADSDQHGIEYGSAMEAALTLAGFTVSNYMTFPAYAYMGDPAGFDSMITTLQASKPDVVILAGYEGAAFESECNVRNYHPKLTVVGPGMETGAFDYAPYGPFTSFSQFNGTMFYDGWPTSAYKSANLSAWALMHYNRTFYDPAYHCPTFTIHWWPYPNSAGFYSALQCLFLAVEKVGLNGTAIRNELATDTFSTLVGQVRLIQGSAMYYSPSGTVTQWEKGNMSDVVWPLDAASAGIIYPCPQYTG